MTRDEIMALEGAELSDAVAEKVMGWKYHAGAKMPGCDWWETNDKPICRDVWMPHELISDAFTVVEKMRVNHNFQMTWNRKQKKWLVSFAPDVRIESLVAIGDDSELAALICRAALVVLEAQ
jgi:hypothetical protein